MRTLSRCDRLLASLLLLRAGVGRGEKRDVIVTLLSLWPPRRLDLAIRRKPVVHVERIHQGHELPVREIRLVNALALQLGEGVVHLPVVQTELRNRRPGRIVGSKVGERMSGDLL